MEIYLFLADFRIIKEGRDKQRIPKRRLFRISVANKFVLNTITI